MRGQVLVKDQPIARGVVLLKPDADKGNTSPHEPLGEIDAQGNYAVITAGRPGAPPGWYKVAVIAMKKDPPRGHVGPLPPVEWLAPKKYTDPHTSRLAFEVKADAAPGSYDLRLTP